MNRKYAILGISMALALLPALAAACTESTFRGNMGMRQYALAGQHPARILIVEGASEATQRDRDRLYAGLRRAGHEVVPVADSRAAADALVAAPYDLLLAQPAAADSVLADIDARSTSQASGNVLPRVLPVLGRDADCTLCIHEGAHLREVLRVIARALHAS